MVKRTTQQNKSLHLFFKLLSDALNDAGLDQRKVLKPHIDIPWTEKAVKERLWKPIQEQMYNTTSTTELEKHIEIDHIHETIMRHLGEKYGVEFIEFPFDPEVIRNY